MGGLVSLLSSLLMLFHPDLGLGQRVLAAGCMTGLGLATYWLGAFPLLRPIYFSSSVIMAVSFLWVFWMAGHGFVQATALRYPIAGILLGLGTTALAWTRIRIQDLVRTTAALGRAESIGVLPNRVWPVRSLQGAIDRFFEMRMQAGPALGAGRCIRGLLWYGSSQAC